MKNYSERAREMFKKFTSDANVSPEHVFSIEQKFMLEEEFKDIPINETKRRRDVMDMINKLDRYVDYYRFDCYIDIMRNEGNSKGLAVVLHRGKRDTIKFDNFSTLATNIIMSLQGKRISRVYVDSMGVGAGLADAFDDVNFKYLRLDFGKQQTSVSNTYGS